MRTWRERRRAKLLKVRVEEGTAGIRPPGSEGDDHSPIGPYGGPYYR